MLADAGSIDPLTGADRRHADAGNTKFIQCIRCFPQAGDDLRPVFVARGKANLRQRLAFKDGIDPALPAEEGGDLLPAAGRFRREIDQDTGTVGGDDHLPARPIFLQSRLDQASFDVDPGADRLVTVIGTDQQKNVVAARRQPLAGRHDVAAAAVRGQDRGIRGG